MKDIDATIKWYEQNRPIFKSLAQKVEDIIKENLEQNKIQYHSVSNRAKDLDSFNKKAQNEKYTDPINEIKDMAGIRVITYLESDVAIVANTVENLFDIDKINSIDQSQLLGSDKLGYRSVHYISKFDKERCKLPECKLYKGLPFEIQIRSILQHSWAEIEHDRNYKFSGKLPTQLQRRFYLISGMLEIADREFVSIAQEIDKYKNVVVEELRKGELDIEINTASLTEYLSKKFEKLSKGELLVNNFKESEIGIKVANELQLFGISRLSQIDEIIPSDLQSTIINLQRPITFSAIIRLILIINDIEKFFKLCWQPKEIILESNYQALLKQYNVEVRNLQKYVKVNQT
jgi:putative GTP pyrophosphokinase